MSEKLVTLSAKFVGRNIAILQSDKFHNALCSMLPSAVTTSIFSELPINVLIELEQIFTIHDIAFEKAWQALCKKCCGRSVSFRRKAIKNSQKYNDSNFDIYTCKSTLISAYFQEVLDGCARNNSTKLFHKRPAYIIQDALTYNKHNISDYDMLFLMSKYILELSISERHTDFLLKCMNDNIEFLQNVCSISMLVKDITYHRRCLNCLEFVLERANVQCLSLRSRGCQETVNKMMKLCSKTNKLQSKNLSIWDEAVADFDQEHSSDYNENFSSDDIYDNMLTPIDGRFSSEPVIYFGNVFNITEFEIVFEHSSQVRQSKCFRKSLPSWFCLTKLTVGFARHVWIREIQSTHSMSECMDFVSGLQTLCETGKSSLKIIDIQNGVWSSEDLKTIARSLNMTKIEGKEIIFDGCVIGSLENKNMEELMSVHTSACTDNTVLSLTARDIMFSANWLISDCVNIFMNVFRPHTLTILSVRDSFWECDSLLSHIVNILECEDPVPSTSVKFLKFDVEPHVHRSIVNTLLERLNSITHEHFSDLSLSLVCGDNHDILEHEVSKITFPKLKKVNFHCKMPTEVNSSTSSTEEFLSQM